MREQSCHMGFAIYVCNNNCQIYWVETCGLLCDCVYTVVYKVPGRIELLLCKKKRQIYKRETSGAMSEQLPKLPGLNGLVALDKQLQFE